MNKETLLHSGKLTNPHGFFHVFPGKYHQSGELSIATVDGKNPVPPVYKAL